MGRAGKPPVAAQPLFPNDDQLVELLFGDDRERARRFRTQIPTLETQGFPRESVEFGGRYLPLVKAFLDRRMGLAQGIVPAAPDGEENWDARPKRHARTGKASAI